MGIWREEEENEEGGRGEGGAGSHVGCARTPRKRANQVAMAPKTKHRDHRLTSGDRTSAILDEDYDPLPPRAPPPARPPARPPPLKKLATLRRASPLKAAQIEPADIEPALDLLGDAGALVLARATVGYPRATLANKCSSALASHAWTSPPAPSDASG